MNIGYLKLDYGEWNNGTYNVQEVGLARAFEKKGHRVYIFYWLNKNDNRCFKEIPISVNIYKIYLPCNFKIGHHVIINMGLLNKYKLDIIHIQTDNLLYAPNAINYCIKHNIKHYCYVGTINSRNNNNFIRFILDKIMQRTINALKKTIVFAKTPLVAKQLKQHGVKNVIVAPVGLDLTIIPNTYRDKKELKDEYKIPSNNKIVVFVCALKRHKKPFDIFQLAELLDDNYSIIHIGDGELGKEFTEKIKQNDKYQKIIHIPQIPNTDIHAFYRIADYVVNLNPQEIFGMSILEAMYQGSTVIAINAPGPDYIIESEKSGFTVNSINKMAEIIKGDTKVLGARERILSNFIWDISADIFLSTIKL